MYKTRGFSALLTLIAFLGIAGAAHASDYRYRFTLSDNVPYQWENAGVVYDDWTDSGSYYDCKNWSPSNSTVGKGLAFTQTSTECSQNQVRTAHPQRKDKRTGKVEEIPGSAYQESQTISTTHTQDAVGILENWSAIASTYTDWKDTNALYGCTLWSPDPSVYTTSNSFTQNSSTCKTDQERERQDLEQEKYTDEIRNQGDPVTEKQTLSAQHASRNYTIAITSWANDGPLISCSNWSPDPSTITIGQTFSQTANDCFQPQTRTRSESYVDHKTGSTVAVSNVTQKQSIAATSTRSSVGTKETWAATTSVYSAWANTVGKVQYSCSNWSPAGSTKTVDGSFTQTATDCKTDQTRTRQDREMETTTKEIRNSAALATESQTLTGQSATRSYTVGLTAWANNGAVTSCTNWSPDPSTVTINKAFTQTATDCLQPQTRTRSESYVDHLSGSTVAVSSVVQTQSITASSTRAAIGTLETWAATTSTYTAWATTTSAYGCTNWSPATSTVATGQSYTQTATDCSIVQSRSRQDRQQETTTGAIRNNGAAVTETQVVTGQSSTRTAVGTQVNWVATTSTYTAWTNTSGAYSCSNWSPAPSTVTINQAYTQTATNCYINQSRTRQDRQVETNTGAIRNNGAAVTETQVIGGQVGYQTATGTKQTWVNIASTYTAWTNTSSAYSCTAWSPASSTVEQGHSFTQSASCYINQERVRQDRQQETTTGAIVVYNSTTEYQTVSGQVIYQTATGTMRDHVGGH
jgi:hypothetical protein